MQTLAEASPKVHETRTTAEGYALSARVFQSGDAELISRRVGADTPAMLGGHKRKNSDKAGMDIETLDSSQRRARTKVRRLCKSFNPDNMLTLTFKDHVTDFDEAWGVFNYFNRLMKQKFTDRWVYVAVPELHKSDCVHFHLATGGFTARHRNIIRAIWRRAAGKRCGNTDLTESKKMIGKNSWNPRRIAQYLSKYITKSDCVGFNKRRYSSAGVAVPEPLKGWLVNGLGLEETLRFIMGNLSELPIEHEWNSDNYLNIHFLTT